MAGGELLGGAVARSSVLDAQARHGDTVGTFDFSDDSMGGDVCCESDDEGRREMHDE